MAELVELESQMTQLVEAMEGQKTELTGLKSNQEDASQTVSLLSGRLDELENWKVELAGLADDDTVDTTDESRKAILKDFLADLTYEDLLKIADAKGFLAQIGEDLLELERAAAEAKTIEQPTQHQVRLSDEDTGGCIELPPDVAKKMPMGMKWITIETVPAAAS